jgi:hypothetical protein
MSMLLLLFACGPDRSAQYAAALQPAPSDDRDEVRGDDDDVTSPLEDDDDDDSSTKNGVDGDSTSGDDTTTTDPAEYCWFEAIDPTANIHDLQPVTNNNVRDRAYEVFRRRWPAGYDLLDDMQHDPYIDVFLESGSWGSFLDSLLTTSHEETHGWDYEHALYPSTFGYFMTGDVQLFTSWEDTIPRSVIRPLIDDDATWLYADLYLTGTQGTYGFTELLDETNCYINTLGAAVAVADGLPWGTSARDGAVTFLYYTGVYLDYVEQHQPNTYNRWKNDPDMQETVRSMWLRTHFFLDLADLDPGLGIEDHRIKPLMYAQQGVFEDFLGHRLDASPCLPDGPP